MSSTNHSTIGSKVAVACLTARARNASSDSPANLNVTDSTAGLSYGRASFTRNDS